MFFATKQYIFQTIFYAMKSLGIYYGKYSAKFAFNNQIWYFILCLTLTEIPTILFNIQIIITCFEIKDLNFSAVL